MLASSEILADFGKIVANNKVNVVSASFDEGENAYSDPFPARDTSDASSELAGTIALLVKKSGRQGNLSDYLYSFGVTQSAT